VCLLLFMCLLCGHNTDMYSSLFRFRQEKVALALLLKEMDSMNSHEAEYSEELARLNIGKTV
jgi:hypothetical protein